MTRQRALRWTGIFALWFFIGLVLSTEVYFNVRVSDPGVKFSEVALPQFQRALLWALLAPLVLWWRRLVPLHAGRWLGGVAFHLAVSFAIMLGYYLARILWIYASMHEAGQDFWSFAYRSYYGRNLIDMVYYWAVLGVAYALQIRERYQRETLRAAQLESLLAAAELQALKHQLNPHFLFNTMNTIAVLVREGRNDDAVQLIARLSSLLRMTLENTRVQTVTVRQELEFLTRYVEIQAARFGDKLTFRTTVESAALDAIIPNLILQPAVENAILHGIAQKTTPGLLELSARVREGRLELEVKDDGPGCEISAEDLGREGIGLTNTRRRLQRHYGANFQMVLRSERGRGVTVAIVLPLHAPPPTLPD